jgi:plastocyanin
MKLRITAAVVSFLAATLAIACGDGDATPTFEPERTLPASTASRIAAATVTPAPSDTPSSGPTAPAATPTISAQPTQPAPQTQPPAPATQPPPPPPPTQPPSVISLSIVARSIRFTKSSLSAPAGSVITVTLDNQDSGVSHDVTFRDAGGSSIAATETFNGPGQRSVTFTPAAGAYAYICTVHPFQMTGTLTVQ